jgi:hypothetical protein
MHYYDQMEWLIPIQTFQVDNVQLGSITYGNKPIIPFAYKDGDMHFNSLSFLLPMLPIKSYDATTGRLVLSMQGIPALNKLSTFQELLLSTVAANQQGWFPGSTRKQQEIRSGYQPMILHSELHLYCPMMETGSTIPFCVDGEWSKSGIQHERLQSGAKVRVALRIQGLSFHIHTASNQWTGKFRIQHKIIAILLA